MNDLNLYYVLCAELRSVEHSQRIDMNLDFSQRRGFSSRF